MCQVYLWATEAVDPCYQPWGDKAVSLSFLCCLAVKAEVDYPLGTVGLHA